jgi:hypothetical protein
MTEEIDLGGIKVPAVDWEATPESIKLVLMFLLEERKQMKEKIEELEERLIDTRRRERARILLSMSQLTQAGSRQPKQRSILQKRCLALGQRFPYALRCLIVLHFLRKFSPEHEWRVIPS